MGCTKSCIKFEESYVFHRHENDGTVIGHELCLDLEVVKDKFFVRHGKSIFQVIKQQKSGCPGIWGGEIQKEFAESRKNSDSWLALSAFPEHLELENLQLSPPVPLFLVPPLLLTHFSFDTSDHQTCRGISPHQAIFCDTSWMSYN